MGVNKMDEYETYKMIQSISSKLEEELKEAKTRNIILEELKRRAPESENYEPLTGLELMQIHAQQLYYQSEIKRLRKENLELEQKVKNLIIVTPCDEIENERVEFLLRVAGIAFEKP
jgi:hypothetical protein